MKKNPSEISARAGRAGKGRGGRGSWWSRGDPSPAAPAEVVFHWPLGRWLAALHILALLPVWSKSILMPGGIFLFCSGLFLPGVPLPVLYLRCLCFLFTTLCVHVVSPPMADPLAPEAGPF